MIVTPKISKQRDTNYRAELEITNTTNNDISNYTIFCKNIPFGSTIDEVRNFKVVLSNGIVTISPKKTILVKSKETLICKFEGAGTMPTEFTSEVPDPLIPSTHNYLYNVPMTNLTDVSQLSGFKYQWSYDKMKDYSDSKPNPDYFKLSQPNGLEINLYKDDKTYKLGSPTEPRTELRGLAVIKDNTKYIYSFDQFLVVEPTFDYCWVQVLSETGPNLMLRWRNGSFQLCSIQGGNSKTKFSGKPSDDVGKWVNWKLEFVLSVTGGYCKVFRDGILVATSPSGNNSGQNNSYIKNGLYAQQEQPSNNVKVYKKNLVVMFI